MSPSAPSGVIVEQANEQRAAAPDGPVDVTFIWGCSGPAEDWEASLRRYAETIGRSDRRCELVIVADELDWEAQRRLEAAVRSAGLYTVLVLLHRSLGDSAAVAAGFREARGRSIVLLPPYAQCDPDDVFQMLQALDEGLDYVASRRVPRVDGRGQQSRSQLYNWLVRRLSGVELHDINSGLRVMRREVLENVPCYGDLHLFLPVLAARQGFRVGEVPVRHLEERVGPDGGGPGVYLRRALDLLTLFFLIRFTQRPFRFFGGLGAGFVAAGGIVTAGLVVQRILGQPLADRPMLVLSTLLIVLGIQMFSLGLLGELIIYVNAEQLPMFHVERVYTAGPRSPD